MTPQRSFEKLEDVNYRNSYSVKAVSSNKFGEEDLFPHKSSEFEEKKFGSVHLNEQKYESSEEEYKSIEKS